MLRLAWGLGWCRELVACQHGRLVGVEAEGHHHGHHGREMRVGEQPRRRLACGRQLLIG